MSTVSANQTDYGFWEFANCGRCQLPFTSPSGVIVPFWLTECGHIICNNHLNVNQSCSICGSPGVQLVPLQQEMDAPMSEWFQSIPIGLDTIANAVKFQYETMASQIRYYRARHQQQRVFIERLKHDVGELKKDNIRLNGEVTQVRQQMGGHDLFTSAGYDVDSRPGQPVDLNSNRKRPRTGVHTYDHPELATSSPRSVGAPVGPNRLTLPQGQQVPNLSSKTIEKNNGPGLSTRTDRPRLGPSITHRPTSGLADKYAYIPPATPQFHPQQLAHTQVAPQAFKRTKPTHAQQMQAQQPRLQTQGQTRRSMPPPPTPSRFKAAPPNLASNNLGNQFSRPSQVAAPPQTYLGQQQMESSSQALRQQTGISSNTQTNNVVAQNPTSQLSHSSALTSNRFFTPLVQNFATPSTATQSSMHTLGKGPQRFTPESRAPSRSQRPDYGGGQRMPFLSGDQQEGGYM